jgi:hypothetical protein
VDGYYWPSTVPYLLELCILVIRHVQVCVLNACTWAQDKGMTARSKVLEVLIPAQALKAVIVSMDIIKGQRRCVIVQTICHIELL